MSSTWPVRESRYWCTRSSTSPQIISGDVRNRSSVDWIVPCPEFSTGTTPKSAAPEPTSSNTSSTLASGSALAECPKCLSPACSENVPSGPMSPTLSAPCCALQADQISRNNHPTTTSH